MIGEIVKVGGRLWLDCGDRYYLMSNEVDMAYDFTPVVRLWDDLPELVVHAEVWVPTRRVLSIECKPQWHEGGRWWMGICAAAVRCSQASDAESIDLLLRGDPEMFRNGLPLGPANDPRRSWVEAEATEMFKLHRPG